MRPPDLLAGPYGPIEYAAFGSGRPTTLFAHGLASSIAGTRPFASGVPGRRVFLHFVGHRRLAGDPAARANVPVPPGPDRAWTYEGLADDLAALADHEGADRALGVSLGAGALLRLASREPERFTRLVLVLPAGLDEARPEAAPAHFERLAKLVEARDVEALAVALAQTYGVEGAAGRWAAHEAHRLLQTDVAWALRRFPGQAPLEAREALSRIAIPVLVIAQEGDHVHPIRVAKTLVGALPDARLETFAAGAMMGADRVRLRALVGGFLGA